MSWAPNLFVRQQRQSQARFKKTWPEFSPEARQRGIYRSHSGRETKPLGFVLPLDRAEELLDRALKLDPDNPAALQVAEQVGSRRAYNFWVPIIAIIAFPLIYLLVRFMRRGKVPKVPES